LRKRPVSANGSALSGIDRACRRQQRRRRRQRVQRRHGRSERHVGGFRYVRRHCARCRRFCGLGVQCHERGTRHGGRHVDATALAGSIAQAAGDSAAQGTAGSIAMCVRHQRRRCGRSAFNGGTGTATGTSSAQAESGAQANASGIRPRRRSARPRLSSIRASSRRRTQRAFTGEAAGPLAAVVSLRDYTATKDADELEATAPLRTFETEIAA
jgi:hypothetical protein